MARWSFPSPQTARAALPIFRSAAASRATHRSISTSIPARASCWAEARSRRPRWNAPIGLRSRYTTRRRDAMSGARKSPTPSLVSILLPRPDRWSKSWRAPWINPSARRIDGARSDFAVDNHGKDQHPEDRYQRAHDRDGLESGGAGHQPVDPEVQQDRPGVGDPEMHHGQLRLPRCRILAVDQRIERHGHPANEIKMSVGRHLGVVLADTHHDPQ